MWSFEEAEVAVFLPFLISAEPTNPSAEVFTVSVMLFWFTMLPWNSIYPLSVANNAPFSPVTTDTPVL